MTAHETSTYRRLPGKKKGFFVGYHTLWQGSGHLLQVYSRLGVEDYKRFYFNDIQAIITRKTAAGKIQNIVLAVLAGLFDLFRGPTCETVLMTAVQTEKLHSLHRIKTTQSVMNQLRSLIEQRQGRISAETVYRQSVRLTGRHTPQTLPDGTKLIQREPKHEKGKVHLLLFALLIVEGLIAVAGLRFNHAALTLMGSVIMMLLGICVVLALVRQHESNLKQTLRTLTWAALGYVCFSFAVGYMISVGLAFKHPEILRDQWGLLKLFSNTSPWESPLMMTANIIGLSAAAFIGIPGLFILKNPHQRILRPSALPAATARIPFPKRFY